MRWKIGDYKFDALKRVLCGKDDRSLGIPASKVLATLIKNFDVERSNPETIREAWGRQAKPGNLRTAITELRAAFGGDRESYIMTGPYRLVVRPEQLVDDEIAPGSEVSVGDPRVLASQQSAETSLGQSA